MGDAILAVLLLVSVAVIGWLLWEQGRNRRMVRQITEAIRAGNGGERATAMSREGREHVQELGRVVGESLEEIRVMEATVEAGETFRDVILGLSQGFLVTNRDMEIIFANDAVRRLFDLSDAPVGRPLIEACRDHRFVEVVREALEKRRRVKAEVNIQGAQSGDLPERLYEVEAAALPEGPGRGCWVVIRDVTEEALTEQVRKDFVANASHELRTPLTLINGYIETLEDGMVEDEEAARKSLAVMRKHSERLVRIIEDMLTISKLEGTATILSLESFSVQDCASDVLNYLSPLVEEKRAKVVLDFKEGENTMVGDRFYWDQVLMNLIENALKENQGKGLKVTVSFRTQDGQNVISVKDNGIGIPRADLPFIFKRFYRGAKHHSQEIKGTGLGLSIVKRAVEAHGGNISVESTPGASTVFTMTVPMHVEAVVESDGAQ
ncbi:MAG: ATP-binding protein [Verrucomicrobiota bacterium]